MGLEFNNPAGRFIYTSAYKIYFRKLITICRVYAPVKLQFLRHILNPQWTENGISVYNGIVSKNKINE